jgi:uncharacterized protein (DUF1501 family)
MSWRCPGGHSNRRDFLRVGALSGLGISLSQYLELKATTPVRAKAQSCILLWLDGGASQVDTWDPKPKSAFKPISTNVSGIQISELFPKIARQMDKLAIIRSLHTEENNHGEATHYAATGHRPNPSMKFPSFCSIVTKETGRRTSVPPYVQIMEMPKGKVYDDYFKAQFIGAQYDPMVIPNPNPLAGKGQLQGDVAAFNVPDLSLPKSLSVEQLDDRRSLLRLVDHTYRRKVESADFSSMDVFTEEAWKMILAPEVRKAFDLSQESQKTRDAYGRNGFGQSVLLARRLVESGSRFVTAGGYKGQAWDTHYENNKLMRETLGPSFDQTVSTLIADLDQRGLLESTLIIAMGEFGRTADINLDGGRDHWCYCWSVLLGGGGLRGGKVVGASDEQGAYVADRGVSMGDVFATVYNAFGIDWTKEYMHPIGRPIKIANASDDLTGKPIDELI